MDWWAISVCVLSFGFIGLSIGQFLHIRSWAAVMIKCWTIFHTIGGAIAAPVRHIHRPHIAHPLGWHRPHRHARRAAVAAAPAYVAEEVCRDIPTGGVPGWFKGLLIGGPIVAATGAALGIPIALELGDSFHPIVADNFMGSGPIGSPVAGLIPPALVPTPPAETVPRQPQTVPEPSSLAIFGAGLGGLAAARWWRRRRKVTCRSMGLRQKPMPF